MLKSTYKMDGKNLYILYPGDFFATNEDCILTTVTGSCVAVCLYDSVRGIGGLRHLIVPGSIGTMGIYADEIAKHSIHSMELLLGEIVKAGGDRRYLKAKVFGGAYMIDGENILPGVASQTMNFLEKYVNAEGIPLEKNDLGGKFRRKIYFYTATGRVKRQILQNNEADSEFVAMEREYIEKELKEQKTYGKVILFD